jgi:F-type H+-transporting ATPase subunit alpha
VAIIWAAANGYLDSLPIGSLARFEPEFLESIEKEFPDIMHAIENEKTISDATDKKLHEAAKKFKEQFQA